MVRRMLMSVARWLFAERPARGKSVLTLQRELEAGAETVADRISNGADSPANRSKAGHVIGIELWAQQRLRTALDEPFREEEHDAYLPDESLDMRTLRDAFLDARHNSLVLAAELHDAGIDPAVTVPHNDLGPMSVRGWLHYLNGHADFESKRIEATEPTAAR